MEDLVAEFGWPPPPTMQPAPANDEPRHLHSSSTHSLGGAQLPTLRDVAKMGTRIPLSHNETEYGSVSQRTMRRKDGEAHKARPLPVAHIKPAIESASIWQEAADDEEWCAWMEAEGADPTASDQDSDEWLACTLADDDPITTHETLEQMSSFDSGPPESTVALKVQETQPHSALESIGDQAVGTYTTSLFTHTETNVYCNPWHNATDSAPPERSCVRDEEVGMVLGMDAAASSSPWVDVSPSYSGPEDEDIGADVRFNPWSGASGQSNGEGVPSRKLPDDLSIVNSHIDVHALSRDETQRQLVIQHCLRSGKSLRYDKSSMIMTKVSAVSLVAWIQKLIEKMRARPKIA